MAVSFTFKGETAIVTGGNRGIGRAIADALVEAGAEVHVFDRDPGNNGGAFHSHNVDVASPAAIADAVAKLPRSTALLVNNAGITRDRTLLKMSDSEWQDVINVNLTGTFNVLRSVAPGMVAAKRGRIVNITSINGLRGKFGQANYAAAKAGLIGLTKTAARELGPKGITVNAVAPGMVLTDMALSLPDEIRYRALEEAVIDRLATPQDIANTVLFLLSDAARLITGQVIQVDGGQYL